MAVRGEVEVTSRTGTREALSSASHGSPLGPTLPRTYGRHLAVDPGLEFQKKAAERTANWAKTSDIAKLKPFVRAFARPDDMIGGGNLPRHRRRANHFNRGHSRQQLTTAYEQLDRAFVEVIARQTKAAAFAAALETEQLQRFVEDFNLEEVEGDWADEPSTLFVERVPAQAKRAIPALLVTTVVTAGLLFTGSMQSHAVPVNMASAAERTADKDASRNASAAAVAAPTTAVPTTVAPPLTEAPTTTVAAPPPPPPPPPTTAAPVGWATPTPGARISSVFGNRVNPVTGRYALHAGVDFAIGLGTPIHVAQSGVVTQAGWEAGYGNYTCVKHSATVTTCYGHQSKINVKVGQTVNRNDVIGLVGSTGNSTGSHLHFEVRLNGTPVNPLPYL